MEAESTSGLAVTNAVRVGHTAMLCGNSAPYAFRMNIRQSRISLAEIDVCSRMISWKRGTRCICCATACASSRMLSHAQENPSAEGKLVAASRTGGPPMRMS